MLQNPPFKSDIFYSVQNEDYQTELAVLQRLDNGPAQRVLMIASSGENVLSLLTQADVVSVDAVDINPAQLHLCELRRTALEHLTRDEQLGLLGADSVTPGSADEVERLALYESIRSHLPEPTRLFWDDRREQELAFGLHYVGRNDVGMHDIQAGLHAAGLAPFQRPLLENDLPAWREVYTSLFTPAYILNLFSLPSESLAAKIADIAGLLGEYHFQALQQPQPEQNPYLTTVFASTYAVAAGEAGFPLYLQEQGQSALRRLGARERLRLHASNLLEQMPALATVYGPYDLISLSNIADWMNEEQFGAVVNQAKTCLKPGGALLARTATGQPMIQQVMAQYMRTEGEFNQELAQIERGPWFRTIAVGFHS
jgi:S-adenosylmethionine:diacylglycerol 3-amino-3-carboxypropyl transferase